MCVGCHLALPHVHSIPIDLCRRPRSLSSIQEQVNQTCISAFQGTIHEYPRFCTAARYINSTLFEEVYCNSVESHTTHTEHLTDTCSVLVPLRGFLVQNVSHVSYSCRWILTDIFDSRSGLCFTSLDHVTLARKSHYAQCNGTAKNTVFQSVVFPLFTKKP